MKTRYKIIIIGMLAALGFLISFVVWETYHSQPMTSIYESTYLSSINPLQRVLNHCDAQRKLATGETPEMNADGSYNVLNAIGLSYSNDTHYIDNNTCEWRLSENEN